MMQALRKSALRHPKTKEGIACKGTPVEKRTVMTRGRAFVYLGAKDAMVKLGDSLDEAIKLAKKQKKQYRVGAHHWVTVTYDAPQKLIEKWIAESYRVVAPPAPAKKSAAKKSKKR